MKYCLTADAPVAFDFVLLPYRGDDPPPVGAERLEVREGNAVVPRGRATALKLRGTKREDCYYLSHGAPALRAFGGVTTDAQLAWIRTQGSPLPIRFLVKGGTRLATGQKVLFSSSGAINGLDVTYRKDQVEVSASGAEAVVNVTLWAPNVKRLLVNGVGARFRWVGSEIRFSLGRARQ